MQWARHPAPMPFSVLGTVTSGNFKLAVLGDYDAVFAATSSTSIAYENRGVYWYHYSSRAMGFAPISTIQLSNPDVYHSNSGATKATRLSWYLDTSWIGYRAGSTSDSTANLYKVVLYCNDLS